MKLLSMLFMLLFLYQSDLIAQKENWYWPFGDSAAIQFTQSGPIFSNSSINSLETSSSYCDSGGNVLVYFGCGIQTNKLKIFNRFHNVMLNGDSINGGATITQGSLLLPFPDSQDSLLSFSISDIAFLPNFYWKVFYSIISLSGDSGKGSVISLNNLLQGNYIELTEKMIAIRHANGRDWWLLLHGSGLPTNKDYIKYLITPFGISGPFTQNIPNSNYHFSGDIVGQMAVAQQGDKIAFAGEGGTLDVLDFDRCSGQLTMRNVLGYTTQSMQYGYYGCCFSPDGNKLYVSEGKAYGYDSIFQFDLSSLNKTLLWITPDSVVLGQMLLGPDNKLYISGNYGKNNSPTLDSANQYLSIINAPDSSGLACNFVPYQVWLGGRRSFGGLPNIPNHSLGRLVGSPCDSLGIVGVGEQVVKKGVQIYPNPNNGFFKVEWNDAAYNEIEIVDVFGALILKKKLITRVTDIDLSMMNNGIYILHFSRNKINENVKKISIVK